MANVCSKCGNNLYGNKTKCPFCGEPINSSSRSSYSKPGSSSSGNKLNSSSYSSNTNSYSGYSNNPNSHSTPSKSASSVDTGSSGWGLLGFCFPIVGIILYLVWQSDQPLNAKAALNGALISIVVCFIFGLFSACVQM
jgi:hypothetical protein